MFTVLFYVLGVSNINEHGSTDFTLFTKFNEPDIMPGIMASVMATISAGLSKP